MDAEIMQKLTDYVVHDILKQRNRVLDPSTKLISSGLIDSFSLIDFVLFIEGTFGVRIEDTELNSQVFDTLDDLVKLIEIRRK